MNRDWIAEAQGGRGAGRLAGGFEPRRSGCGVWWRRVWLCGVFLCWGWSGGAAPGYWVEWDAAGGGGGVSTAGAYGLVDCVGQAEGGAGMREEWRWEAGFTAGLNLQPESRGSDWVVDEDSELAGWLTGWDVDGDGLRFALESGPAQGTVVLQEDGWFIYTGARDYNGGDAFTFRVNDGELDSGLAGRARVSVMPVNDAPMVDVTPEEQGVQYSDSIEEVWVRGSDKDTPGWLLSATCAWGMKGESGGLKAGLPEDLALMLRSTSDSDRVWSIGGLAQVGPGEYVVEVRVTDDEGAVVTREVTLRVGPEDARASYTGALFASTASASSSVGTVTLSATVQDITAVLGDADYDEWAGEIGNATVRFVDRDSGSTIAEGMPVGLVSVSDGRTGTATYDWKVDIGNVDSRDFTVGMVVEGWYSRNAPVENTIVTVSKPLASDFITGGGYLVLERSAGLHAGDAGTKANFGFNVKYNKSAKNLQGHINIMVRSGGRVYQAKGNVMSSLSVVGNEATFNGKASIADITDVLLPISVDGNATLQVVMRDNGDPGDADTIALTVWNKSGGLWFASRWNGTRTEEQVLAGGNLVVRSGRKLSSAAPVVVEPTKEEPLLLRAEGLREPGSEAGGYGFVLRFPVVPRRDYGLERSADLVNWRHLTTVMSLTDAVEYFDRTDSAAGGEYYRVRATCQAGAGAPNANIKKP